VRPAVYHAGRGEMQGKKVLHDVPSENSIAQSQA